MIEAGMQRWQGRVALVTGASSGIGRAVARALVRHGMRVAACARRRERLRDLQGELASEPGSLLPIVADLRQEAHILDMFGQIRREWGGVDVLVNSAGIGHKVSLIEGDSQLWRDMWLVNVLALSICTREAVRDMRQRGDDGHVIHLSSLGAYRQNPAGTHNGMYAATKFAVRALTEALRRELRELGSLIRVTAISPGLVKTEFAAHFHGDEEAGERTYRGRMVLQPEDIASLVCYVLACPPHVQVHDVLVRPTTQET